MSQKRTVKTEEQIKVLKELRERGMTSYGKDHLEARLLIEEAVKKTSLTERQVKVRRLAIFK